MQVRFSFSQSCSLLLIGGLFFHSLSTAEAFGAEEQRNSTAQNKTSAASKAPKQAPPATKVNKNGTAPGTLQNQNSTLKEGWIQVEPGTRPVYVGIHGGTVPLSLVQGPDGELFALAGETGSDFMKVLQGNTTTRKHSDNKTVTASSPAPVVNATDAHNPLPAPSMATAKQPATTNATSTPLPAGSSPKAATSAKKPQASASSQKTDSALSASRTANPANGHVKDEPVLVIASSGMASKMAQNQEPLRPFGLAATEDSDSANEYPVVPPAPRKISPLKLGNYKNILGLP